MLGLKSSTGRLCLLPVILSCLLGMAGRSVLAQCSWGGTSAVAAPSLTYLRLEQELMKAPGRIAIDGLDSHFVSDPAAGRIIVRNDLGRLISVIEGLTGPLALAVDELGSIYVGESGSGSVAVFDAAWTLVDKLGSGDGEFQNPIDIAIDTATGNAFVADGDADLIKVYNAAGAHLFSFGGTGTATGRFDFPSAVHVTSGAEVWVGDQNNDRLQVFGTDGTFLRCFGYQSGEARKFGRIEGIAEDSLGRIYVADGFHGHVKVLDQQGVELAAVAAFGEGPGELKIPIGVAIDSSNRLFIASHNTGRVEVYGIDSFSDPTDPDPAGTVQFESAALSGLESSGVLRASVIRTSGSSGMIRATYWTTDGSAMAGADYQAVQGAVVFAPGDTSPKTIDVPVHDDSLYEGDENVTLTLGEVVGGSGGSPAAALLTIEENDPPSPGILQFDSADYKAVEHGGVLTVTVTRTGGSDGAVSASHSTSGGSAFEGVDYQGTSGIVSFATSETAAKSFDVPLVDDGVFEGDEWMTVALQNPTGGATVGPVGSSVLTILENDVVPPSCPLTLDLSNRVVSSLEVFEAEETVTAGDPLAPFQIVSPGGDVTLRSRQRVILQSGFSVESGAALSVVIDPGVCAAEGRPSR